MPRTYQEITTTRICPRTGLIGFMTDFIIIPDENERRRAYDAAIAFGKEADYDRRK